MATYLAVFALVLAYLALVAGYLALRTLAKVRRSVGLLSRGVRGDASGPADVLAEEVAKQAEQSAVLAEQLADLHAYVETRAAESAQLVDEHYAEAVRRVTAAVAPRSDEAGALRNVALVRYDAFTDMSGRMSFSLALLDAAGDGVVISAIAAPTDTRVYAKGIAAGKGDHELSPEEAQAVRSALDDKRGGLLSRKAG